jgi:hypothetical protein
MLSISGLLIWHSFGIVFSESETLICPIYAVFVDEVQRQQAIGNRQQAIGKRQ